jgi:hypothetical protein
MKGPATERRGPLHVCLFFVSKFARGRNDPFRPFPKLFGPCDTHFCRFQNRLGLATSILAVFKIVWPLRHPFWPFSKTIGPCDTHFGRFQKCLGLATLILAIFKIKWVLRHPF